jgi:hypothetical protein
VPLALPAAPDDLERSLQQGFGAAALVEHVAELCAAHDATKFRPAVMLVKHAQDREP